ncbi:MAG: hypothetical protein AAF846_26890 [Chloroflexota bacterium]
MNIRDYLAQASQINQTLIQDPKTLLALTVAWIDPLSILKDQAILEEEELADYYYAGDRVGESIHVARNCFPDIYASAINKLRKGESSRRVLDFIDVEIENQTGILVTAYGEGHAYAYGIPMEWYGFDMGDPDFYDEREDEWHLASLFGIYLEEDPEHDYLKEIKSPDDAWEVAYTLKWSLQAYCHSPLHETLMNAIALTFSCSGNSSVDYSANVGHEFYPLQWTPDEVAYASLINREAAEIMQSAVIGLTHIYDPVIQACLRQKIQLTSQHIKDLRDKGENIRDRITDETPNPLNIRWDDLRASLDDATQPDATELPLRLGVT